MLYRVLQEALFLSNVVFLFVPDYVQLLNEKQDIIFSEDLFRLASLNHIF